MRPYTAPGRERGDLAGVEARFEARFDTGSPHTAPSGEARPGRTYSSSTRSTSRLRKIGPESQSFVICSAKLAVSGSDEFRIASS